ncbi:MAG: dihydrolipoyl dehydrogenase [archaeon]
MYDAIVIGSGPAGYTCAVRVAQLGGKVIVVEKDLTGGICTNWGCIPTKAMITSAKIVDTIKKSSRLGIEIDGYKINFDKIIQHRDRVVGSSRKGIESLFASYGIEIIRGEGKVISVSQVKVGDRIIEGKNIVIATGSSPIIPPFIRLSERVHSSSELLQIKKIPQSLAVIGGGVIGLEFATLFSTLGSEVTIIEMMDRILINCDIEISAELARQYSRSGIKILTKHKVKEVRDGFVKCENLDTGKDLEITPEYILVAIGRRANIDAGMLESVGIKYDKNGIFVDDYLRTNIPSVFALGDATGKSILAHVGIEQGTVAADNIMGKNRKIEYIVPACIYTFPEVAEVGKHENEVIGARVGKFPFIANARGRCEVHTVGFYKVVVKDDVIVGAQVIGQNATELIAEAALAIKNKISAVEIMDTIHAHPTYAESFKAAVEDAYGKAIDLPPNKG